MKSDPTSRLVLARLRRIAPWAGAALGVAVVVAGTNGQAQAPTTAELTAIRVVDFRPRSMLRVGETRVERARFPVVDFHQHISLGGNALPIERILQTMDATNVRTMVNFSGGSGAQLQQSVAALSQAHPGRFVVFANANWALLKENDFGEKLAAQLRVDVANGARGLKIFKALGLNQRLPNGQLLAVDDPRLDPLWRAAGELRIPVAIHVGDPDAFFEPLDRFNERLDELRNRPDWSYHGRDVPHVSELRAALERVFRRNPETLFVSLHVGNWPENLDYVSRILTEYPNVHIEIGARHAELGRQPRRARRLFIEHQDKILFGTDIGPNAGNNATQPVYVNYFRFLETADEHFDYWNGQQGRWKIYGVELPDDVLRKVYYANADRIFAWFNGGTRP